MPDRVVLLGMLAVAAILVITALSLPSIKLAIITIVVEAMQR